MGERLRHEALLSAAVLRLAALKERVEELYAKEERCFGYAGFVAGRTVHTPS